MEARPGLAGAIEVTEEYSTLARLASETGVLETLASGGPYTVLAPTNIAFVYVGAEALPVLTTPAQRPILARVLRHHIVEGRLAPEDFVDGAVLTSLDGEPLRVQRVGDEVVIEGATIDLGDASVAENGIAYPTSNVVRTNLSTRERIELSPTFAVFADFARRTGLFDEASDLKAQTAIIPVNDAFEAVPETSALLAESRNADVLTRVIRPHLLPGRVDLAALPDGTRLETLGGQTVTVTQRAGVVYVDGVRVLSRAYDTADGRIYLFGGLLFKGLSLAERLRVLPRVTFFPSRIQTEADVWARMNDRDDALTVFAPRDAVYIRQNASVRLALDQPENEALLRRTRRVLVVEGRYDLADLVDGQVLQALDGSELLVQRANGNLFVGGRNVTPTGATVSNGAIYTLGAFIPPSVDGFDSAILRGYTTFSEAARRAGLEGLVREEALSILAPTNEAFGGSSGIFGRSDLADVIRYHLTETILPLGIREATFTTLQGAERSIVFVPDEPEDPDPPLFLDGSITISPGALAYDRRSALFGVDSVAVPAGSRSRLMARRSAPSRTRARNIP